MYNYKSLGYTYFKFGDIDIALKGLKYLESIGIYSDAIKHLGHCYLILDQREKALIYYREFKYFVVKHKFD